MKATTIYLAVAMGLSAFAASADDASIATKTPKEGSMTNTASTPVTTTVRVRYMVNDLDPAVTFYTKYLGFRVTRQVSPNFAMLSRGNLELVLSTPFGPGGAARPMPDGRKPEPGGWNRIIINVDDLAGEVARLRNSKLQFRNDIVNGPGGSEILLDDPSGNPIELFQPSKN
jgi:catechol 2,3-dioxygenase-like lactoylglutathione lyase family enzyme